MAVTVIDRPLGHKLGTEAFNGAVTNASGDALVTRYVGIVSTPHGLTDGDYVYIESSMDSYNGFYEIDVITPETYKLVLGDGFVPYKQYNELFYYVSDLDHGWQCVHLPIVYELESDLYPINSVDTITILSSPYTGGEYMNFTVPASIGLVTLDYVLFKETPTHTGSYYQVIQVTNIGVDDVIYINKSSTGSLYSVQKARNNYHIDVNVYAGLPAGHPWESEKPYELATTLRFIPDSNNQVKFSIADILKGYINTRNNLTLDTLPNNIDFFTSFYIEYAEGYDVSNGTEITAFLGEFTDDSEEFEGDAVNAMLSFKNQNISWMSGYVGIEGNTGRWLSTQEIPLVISGYYFDLSFIMSTTSAQILMTKKYGGGYLLSTTYEDVPEFGVGIYRVSIENDCETISAEIETNQLITNSEFTNNLDGWTPFGWVWSDSPDRFGDGNGYAVLDTDLGNLRMQQPISLFSGEKVSLNARVGTSVDGTYSFEVYVVDEEGDGYQLFNIPFTVTSGSISELDEVGIVPDGDFGPIQFYAIYFLISSPPGNDSFINNFKIFEVLEVTEVVDEKVVSIILDNDAVVIEEKTLKMICDCNGTMFDDELRLLESGPYRKLE